MTATWFRAAFCSAFLGALLLGAPAVRSDSNPLGGRFTFPNANNTYTNPCAGNAAVNGAVNFTAVVSATRQGGGKGTVLVSVLFTGGVLTDALGNKYVMRGSGTALYDTPSDHYVVPTNLEYTVPSNPSLDFTGSSDTTVFVDQNQKPFAFRNAGAPPVCAAR
jgi:hypothetical protein